MSNSITIRAGERDDLSQIVGIYNYYVAETHITFDTHPTSVAARSEWFDDFATHPTYQLFVATDNSRVVGYAHARSFRPKPAYSTSVETTVYLAAGEMGKGTGPRLYKTLLDSLEKRDIHRAYGAVALPNEGSVALHLKLGFKSLCIFDEVGRKFGRYYDLQWFEKKIAASD